MASYSNRQGDSVVVPEHHGRSRARSGSTYSTSRSTYASTSRGIYTLLASSLSIDKASSVLTRPFNHLGSADSGYGSCTGSSSSSGSQYYNDSYRSGRSGMINYDRPKSSNYDSRYDGPHSYESSSRNHSSSRAGYCGDSRGTGWSVGGYSSRSSQSSQGILSSGGGSGRGGHCPPGIQLRRDISSPGRENESAAANEQPAETLEGKHVEDFDAPSSDSRGELLLDSGAEDDSNSSDGEDEDEGDGDGSEYEVVTPQHRTDGQRTSSGSSSDASLVSPLLDVRRRHMVGRLMVEFRDLLNQTIGARGRPSGETSRSGSSSTGQGSRKRNSQGSDSNRVQGARWDQPPLGNDETGGGGNPGEGSKSPGTPGLPLGRKFACPYFKRDPRKHGKHRSCVGPGWTTIHRVKYATPIIIQPSI